MDWYRLGRYNGLFTLVFFLLIVIIQRDLEVVVFELQNNSPSYLKGYTNGYAPPTQDANASVNVNTITYQGIVCIQQDLDVAVA